jgi:molybdopterin-guanine dinucleotide biosynthesis protein A
VGGQRIIDRVAGALREVVSELVLVSNAPDAARWLPAVSTIGDARPERGSVVGIHTAVAHARGDVLVVAWDMPFVTPALLALIRDRSAPDAFATVPEGPAGLEPLCAIYSPACLPFIEAAIDDGQFRLSRVLERLPSLIRIPSRDVAAAGDVTQLFFNVNDAADLAAAERLAAVPHR